MRIFMGDYYANMKDAIGIDAAMPDDEEHPHLEDAIKIIRPNMDPKAFVNMMKSEKMIHKDTKNKAIIRKTVQRNKDN